MIKCLFKALYSFQQFTQSLPFTHAQHSGRFSSQTRLQQQQILLIILLRRDHVNT